MYKNLILFLFVIFFIPQSKCEENKHWPEKYYNPQPISDDLILPMPCGGKMVFRKVEVPSDGWLGDRRIVVGGHDERFGYSEQTRFSYIAGSFTQASNETLRYYYLGKYEVMQMQFEAFKNDCSKPNNRGRLPAVGVSWFDAVHFAHNYTEWLMQSSPESLPKEEGMLGIVRLPTESEWEFAVRGGVAVIESEFENKTFPIEGGLQKYVWFQGSKSANGKLQVSGLLTPNPLGLFDTLGNIDEIVLEPFRLNKFNRLHGQAGGFIIKGGNYFTSERDIRSSYRQEVPHFKKFVPNQVKTIGFRLALSVPVITSREKLSNIKDAWDKLPKIESVRSKEDNVNEIEDPLNELQLMKNNANDVTQIKRINRIEQALLNSAVENKEQKSRAAISMLRLGAFLGVKLSDDNKRLLALQNLLRGIMATSSDSKKIVIIEQKLKVGPAILNDTLKYYSDIVIEVSREYSDEVISAQEKKILAEFRNRKQNDQIGYERLFSRCVKAYRANGKIDARECLKSDIKFLEL